MDVEAKRIMALSISKLYSMRSQRGGPPLHRSLLLSMTMRAARDIYHCARLTAHPEEEEEEQVVPCAPEPMDTGKEDSPPGVRARDPGEDKENGDPSERISRKRRGGKAALEPDYLPPKRARLEEESAEVLRTNSGNCCRPAEARSAFPASRAVAAC